VIYKLDLTLSMLSLIYKRNTVFYFRISVVAYNYLLLKIHKPKSENCLRYGRRFLLRTKKWTMFLTRHGERKATTSIT
jgi:hypothetical protein